MVGVDSRRGAHGRALVIVSDPNARVGDRCAAALDFRDARLQRSLLVMTWPFLLQ
jgi:hypothetical protein